MKHFPLVLSLLLSACAVPPNSPESEAQRAAYCATKGAVCAAPLPPGTTDKEKYLRDLGCAVNIVCLPKP